MEKLPYGVHQLSQESIDALKRAADKCAAVEAKHTKRAA